MMPSNRGRMTKEKEIQRMQFTQLEINQGNAIIAKMARLPKGTTFKLRDMDPMVLPRTGRYVFQNLPYGVLFLGVDSADNVTRYEKV